MTDRPHLLAAGGSDQGLLRDQNEDRWLVDATRGVFCVVDGVGGHPGGERASEIAAETLRARLTRETGSRAERLREAIALANNEILDATVADSSLVGMTCVLTAALVDEGRVTVGHVGDSRIYKLRHGAIAKLTRDHSPVGEREDAGELSEEEAMRHPRRNEVYRDVGAEPHSPEDDRFVDIVDAPFEEDAALVLCSDGLSDQVPSASIRRMVEAHAGRPADAVDALIRAANDAGGKDNVTVVLVYGTAFGTSQLAPRLVRGRVSHWAMLALGGVFGLAAAGAGVTVMRPEIRNQRPGAAAEVVPDAPRTWRVGLAQDADAATITDALQQAGPGDSILLDSGEYREAVVVRRPVRIEGPDSAVLLPPLGAEPGWTAVHIVDANDVTLRGFTISGADGQPLARGVRVENGAVTVTDVRVSRARDAGVDVGPGAHVTIRASVLLDNPGSAIVVASGAELNLRDSLVLRNGTAAAAVRPAIELGPGARATIAGNAFGDNAGAAVGGESANPAALLANNIVHPVPRPAAPRRPAASQRTTPPQQ